MELKNTSRLPDQFIRGAFRFIVPKTAVRPKRVVVRHTRKAFHGHARPGHLYVWVDVGGQEHYPFTREPIKGRGYLGVQLASPEEALVYVLAHELRHLWQFWNPNLMRLGGGRGRLSERDADTFAQLVLDDWRVKCLS